MKTMKVVVTNPDRISQGGGVKIGHIGKVFSIQDSHCVAYNPKWTGCLTERGLTVKTLSRCEFEVIE